MSNKDKARSKYQAMLNEVNEKLYKFTLQKRAYEVALEQLAENKNKPKNNNQSNNTDSGDKYKCDDCGRLNVTEAVKEYCLKKKKYNGKLYCFECQQKH